jgi:hypothetical protein
MIKLTNKALYTKQELQLIRILENSKLGSSYKITFSFLQNVLLSSWWVLQQLQLR